MRIKIVEPTLRGFTGNLAGLEFVGGVSVEDVPRLEINRIGASIRIVDASTERPVGAGESMIEAYAARSAQPAPVAPAQAVEQPASVAPAPAGAPERSQGQVEQPVLTWDFTRESLESRADKGGIAALRDFAGPYGVRGRAIKEIIDELLQAQQKSGAQGA